MQQINNLLKHINIHENIIKKALDRVLDSGWLVLGPEVTEFERSFSEYIGARYCVSVANGTDAIELALRTFDLKFGDKVATIANAGMYSTTAILALGAKPYFMDVDIDTKLVTLVEVENAIAAGAKAVILTHLYGLAIMESAAIFELCNKHGVLVLEDCAQAHGAKINGQNVGSFGDIASFSFYPTKNLGAYGDGGFITTNNFNLYKKIRRIRYYGIEQLNPRNKFNNKYYSFEDGINSRLDEVQSSILNIKIKYLKKNIIKKKKIAEIYNKHLNIENLTLPKVNNHNEHTYHQYVVRSKDREVILKNLKKKQIYLNIIYPYPTHVMPPFKQKNKLKNTEKYSKEIFSLPIYPNLSKKNQMEIINSLKEALNFKKK